MHDWTERKLGDLVDIKHGFAFKSEFFREESPGDVLLTPGNFAIGGGFQDKKLKYYDGPVPGDFICLPGDLLVTMTDLSKAGDTLGYPAIVPDDGRRYLHNQRLGKILVRPRAPTTKKFLYWVLRTDDYRHEVLASCSGSTVKHTSPAKICAYRFRLPPVGEQSAIASVLGVLDDKIELNRWMSETLEAMARALFKDWFVDFGPVRAKAEGKQPPGLSPEIAALFPDALDDDDKPVGWGFATLAEVAALNPESWSKNTAPEGIEYVDLANTKWGVIKATQRYDWSKAPSRAKRILRVGDTIVGTVLPANGSYSFIGVDGLTGSTGFAVLRPKRPEHAEFVYLAATSPESIERLSHLADGTVYPAVRPDVVAATEVFLSDKGLISSFSKTVGPMMPQIEANKLQNQTLAQLRDLLLPKLMSGEIRLQEAEKAVEAVA